jgi:hypothetical protein
MVLQPESEEGLLVGGATPRRREDVVLNGSKTVPVHGHALWPLQISNDV